MKLQLCWKDIEDNSYKIGILQKEKCKYIFILIEEEYKRALENGCAGIGNLESEKQGKEELFQFFKERIPGKDSPRLKLVLNMFNMHEYDEMELLAKSKAKVNTDRFYVEEV